MTPLREAAEIQWSDWGERHGRQSREGNGRALREAAGIQWSDWGERHVRRVGITTWAECCSGRALREAAEIQRSKAIGVGKSLNLFFKYDPFALPLGSGWLRLSSDEKFSDVEQINNRRHCPQHRRPKHCAAAEPKFLNDCNLLSRIMQQGIYLSYIMPRESYRT
jgi:hypothetical protein